MRSSRREGLARGNGPASLVSLIALSPRLITDDLAGAHLSCRSRVESLGGSAGSVADGSLAFSTRSLRSAGQSSIYDTRIGMGKQALSQFVSPPGGGFARSLRPSPGLQTLSGEVGSSFPSVVEKQPLSRYPSAKTMVFGTSQRPGPADGLVRRKAPGPGTYEGQGGFGAQPSSRTRTAPTAKFGTGRRLNLTDPKQTL